MKWLLLLVASSLYAQSLPAWCSTHDPCLEQKCSLNSGTGLTLTLPGHEWWGPAPIDGRFCMWARASGGTPPYYYSAKGFPKGITVNKKTGLISGLARDLPH